MSTKVTRELHSLDTRELELRLQEAQNNLIGLRFNLATRKTENTSGVRTAKREVARINTILRERELEA